MSSGSGGTVFPDPSKMAFVFYLFLFFYFLFIYLFFFFFQIIDLLLTLSPPPPPPPPKKILNSVGFLFSEFERAQENYCASLGQLQRLQSVFNCGKSMKAAMKSFFATVEDLVGYHNQILKTLKSTGDLNSIVREVLKTMVCFFFFFFFCFLFFFFFSFFFFLTISFFFSFIFFNFNRVRGD